MHIPAVVATGPFLTDVSGGDLIIIDGNHGRIILEPDEETIARYRHEVEEHRSLAVRLRPLADKPAVTEDGTPIHLYGNIEFPYEVEECNASGADGIGLYRTEFLYLNAKTEPTEETHFEAYKKVLLAMAGKPVCIRTLDLGAEKLLEMSRPEDERNPVLGLRSIRLTLRNVPLFPNPVASNFEGQRTGNNARDVSADHNIEGTSSGQNVAHRCDGRSRRAEY